MRTPQEESTEISLEKAHDYLREGAIAAARGILERLLAVNENDQEALDLLWSLEEEGPEEGADPQITVHPVAALRSEVQNLLDQQYIADARWTLEQARPGFEEEAELGEIERLVRIAEERERNVQDLFSRGMNLLESHDLEDAEEALKQLQHLAPQGTEAEALEQALKQAREAKAGAEEERKAEGTAAELAEEAQSALSRSLISDASAEESKEPQGGIEATPATGDSLPPPPAGLQETEEPETSVALERSPHSTSAANQPTAGRLPPQRPAESETLSETPAAGSSADQSGSEAAARTLRLPPITQSHKSPQQETLEVQRVSEGTPPRDSGSLTAGGTPNPTTISAGDTTRQLAAEEAPLGKRAPTSRPALAAALLLILLAAAWWTSSLFESPELPELEFTRVSPIGPIQLGCATTDKQCAPDETPFPLASMAPFELAVTETTWGQYQRCVEARRCAEPWSRRESPPPDDHPVTGVTWENAQAFCRWAAEGRLPTEIEWELAARAGGTLEGKYPTGATLGPSLAHYGQATCCSASDAGRWPPTRPVGSFDANGLGLKDMAGNVAEWTASRYEPSLQIYEPLTRLPERTADSSEGLLVTVRGGSWIHPANMLRVSARQALDPELSAGTVGFRCLRAATAQPDDRSG